MGIHLKFFHFLKDLAIGKKVVVTQLRVPETSKEGIEYPETYKAVSLPHSIPARPAAALTGTQFAAMIISALANQHRDNSILAQCLSGNIPNWMREFKPITVTDNVGNSLTYFVSPDVLCVGTDDDFLRVSLNGYTARKVADAFDCMLPTKRMSDQIWQNANLRMMPTGMGASFQMTSVKTLMNHNAVIEKQRAGRNFNIIAGHKKDIIIHSKLLTYTNNICIYGWHYPDGKPLQGTQYMAHDVFYQDYSHSIRLIAKQAVLNGQRIELTELLNNRQYCHLISDEGAYNATTIYKK
jgi:hypothetical protein